MQYKCYQTILRLEAKWINDILDENDGYVLIPVTANTDYGHETASQQIANTIPLQYKKD